MALDKKAIQSSDVLNEFLTTLYQQSISANGDVALLNDSVRDQFSKPESPISYKSRFLIKDQARFYTISVKEVAYFFAQDRQVYLKTQAGLVHKVRERIEDIEQVIDPWRFFRINRGMIISYECIVEMTYLNSGKFSLTVTPDLVGQVVVSKERMVAFKKWLDS